MHRTFSIAIIMLVALSIGGCAHLEKGVEENSEKIAAQNRETLDLRVKVDKLESELKKVKAGSGGSEDVQQDLYRISDEKKVLESRLSEVEARLMEMEKAKVSAMRIKVLSGDGRLSTAKETAGKLRDLGYSIERTDLAPSKKFKTNKVFYSPDYRSEATTLALNLGSDTVVKPLTWNSVFDIIVVSIGMP